MVRAGAGTGKTTVLVERFVRAVVEDGVRGGGDPRDHVHREGGGRDADARARALRRARPPRRGARGRGRLDLDHPRLLRARAARPRAQRRHRPRLPRARTSSRPSGSPPTPSTARSRRSWAADPERLEMVAAYTADGLSDMVRTAYSRLRSQGQRRPRLDELPAPTPPAQAGAPERAAARAALRELGAAGDGVSVGRAIAKVERCAALLERVPAGALAEPGELEDLSFGGNAKALCTEPCVEYREALAAYAALCSEHTRVPRPRPAARAARALRRALRGRQARALGARLRGPRAARARPARRARRACASSTRSASRTCWWTSSRTRTRSRTSCSSCSSATTCSGSATRTSRSTASATPTSRCSAATGRAAAAAAGPRASRSTSAAAARCSRRSTAASPGIWPERLRAAARGRRRARAPPRVEPCVELLVTDRDKRRWDEALGADDPFGAAMHAATPWRAAEARLLAKRVDELRARGRLGVARRRAAVPRHHHMSFYERALEERGIPTHVVGGRGYWAQQQVADLRHWLAALANPLDELAVYSVLASPLGGLSLDAVALIGLDARAHRTRPLVAAAEPRRAARRCSRPADRRRAARVRRAVRGRAARGAAGVARDADRPGRHPHRLRPPHRCRCRPARGGWRTCAS